jgi:3-oxoacid CoA-transferase subunit B
VIVAMTHNSKDGKAKVVRELSLPVTCRKSVNLIVTDLAVIKVTKQCLILTEYAPGWTAEEVLTRTDAPMTVAKDAHEIEF